MTFDIKVTECDSSKIYKRIYELETEWLSALLSRAGVSKILIKKALTDQNYSSSDWRNFLFDRRGITITKDLGSESVTVNQINFESGQKVKIGEWTKPNIIRKKGETVCQLELKYWQII